MDKRRYRQRDEHLFALTAEERESFGWEPGQMVFSTRGPNGMRFIPTRDVTPSGKVVYGSLEVMEAPPGISDEDWAVVFGTDEHPRAGITH